MNDTFPKGPGNPKHRTKDTDTRVQTMPGARNREGEHGKLVLITWRLWLGGGRGEERRQTRAVFPATVSAPPPEATGAMAPGRDPPFPLGKKGGGGVTDPLEIPRTELSEEQTPGDVCSISAAPPRWVTNPRPGLGRASVWGPAAAEYSHALAPIHSTEPRGRLDFRARTPWVKLTALPPASSPS